MNGNARVYHIQTTYKYIDRENVRDLCVLSFDNDSYMNSRYVCGQTLWSRIQTKRIEDVIVFAKMMSEDTHTDMKNKEAYDFELRIAIIKNHDKSDNNNDDYVGDVEEPECEFGFDIGIPHISTITVQIIYKGDVITSSNKLCFNRADRLLDHYELFDEDNCYHDDFSYRRGNLKRMKL